MSESYERFRKLIIWQKAQDLAELVTIEVGKLPRSRSIDAIASQVLRSAGSVPANVAEGYGRYYEGAYRNHLSIARGSLFETESWIDLLFRSNAISAELNSRLLARCSEVGRLLTAQMKSLESKAGYRVRDGQPVCDLDEVSGPF